MQRNYLKMMTKVGVLTLPYFKTQCKQDLSRVLDWFKNKEISGL